MTVTHVQIGGGFWLNPPAASSYSRLQTQMTAAFGFPIVLTSETINGHLYYSGAGRTPAEQAVINPGQIVSDHVLGQAIDIYNQHMFRLHDQAKFLSILADNGWHNIDVRGADFPKEPWHFAWRGTATADNSTTSIDNTTKEEDEPMTAAGFKLSDGTGKSIFYQEDPRAPLQLLGGAAYLGLSANKLGWAPTSGADILALCAQHGFYDLGTFIRKTSSGAIWHQPKAGVPYVQVDTIDDWALFAALGYTYTDMADAAFGAAIGAAKSPLIPKPITV